MDFDLVFDVGDIGCGSRGHIVEDCDLVALGNECITEVRADKTGATGDENAHSGKSIGASIDLSRLALGADSDNSQADGAGFGYEVPNFPQVHICGH